MVVVALVAGATPAIALRLGVAMVCLQASIGALNDLVDAPVDADLHPGKPIPAGWIPPDVARGVVIVAAGLGFLLVAPSGPLVMVVAGAGLAIGYAYDLAFRGTPWSWLPFAVGIPLLPVYAWLGATGTLPAMFGILVPMAMVAGAAIAIANARVDHERDLAAGTGSVATALGLERSWTIHVGLLVSVVAVAITSLVATSADGSALAIAVGGASIVAVGATVGRSGDPLRRERAWEIEAVGLGLLAVGWLAGMTAVA